MYMGETMTELINVDLGNNDAKVPAERPSMRSSLANILRNAAQEQIKEFTKQIGSDTDRFNALTKLIQWIGTQLLCWVQAKRRNRENYYESVKLRKNITQSIVCLGYFMIKLERIRAILSPKDLLALQILDALTSILLTLVNCCRVGLIDGVHHYKSKALESIHEESAKSGDVYVELCSELENFLTPTQRAHRLPSHFHHLLTLIQQTELQLTQTEQIVNIVLSSEQLACLQKYGNELITHTSGILFLSSSTSWWKKWLRRPGRKHSLSQVKVEQIQKECERLRSLEVCPAVENSLEVT